MSLYQYEIINKFIYSKNVYSKEKDKILEFIHEIMDKPKKFFNPGTVLIIDWRIISIRGRNLFIVYDNLKPNKCGCLPFVLSDKNTGYTISM